MKRINVLWLILDSLFLVVFNLLFFMFSNPETRNQSVWISYGFIHFAYLLLLVTPMLVRRGSADYIYRRPLFAVTSSYFIVELVIGVIFILVAPDTIKVTLIVQALIAAIYVAWLLAHLIANEHMADNAERHEAELQYVKESSAKIHSILQQVTDRATAKKVERVYDLIYSSPVKSNASVCSLEQQVISEIERLSSVASQNDTAQIVSIANTIYRLADERNRQLKKTSL